MLGTLKWLALDSRAVPDYLDRISTTATWTALCASHGYHTVARTETVKVIIDL